MKFLIQIPQLIYGGAEKVLVNFANCLVENGHDVEILEIYERGLLKTQFNNKVKFNSICSNEYNNKYYASLKDVINERHLIKKIDKLKKLVFSKIVGYRRFAEKLSAKYYSDKVYDVAINYLETESPDFIVDNINANKYMQWIHIDVKRLAPGELDGFAVDYRKKIDNIICVSETAQQSFCELYPELKNKTNVIYNFFDIDDIQSKSKETINYNYKDLKILSIGRMVEQKGYLRALNVINSLKKDGYKFRWYIIGEGIEKKQIEKYIKNNDLKEDIKLLGLKDNPYPYIKACDFLFLPSIYEGFPTVTIEAKVLKKPVLSTEVSGIKEQIENNKNGIIVENSEKGIYDGLKYIFDNPDVLKELENNDGMESVLDNKKKYDVFMKLCK